MTLVNESLTRKVADLARLELTDAEVKEFTQQLGQILSYVDQLSQVDVQGVEPLTHPSAQGSEVFLREDRLQPFPADEQGQPKVLGSAPEVFDAGLKVPPIS